MLLIYIPRITNRIVYVLDYVFKERLGIEYTMTTDRESWLESTGAAKFSYTNEKFDTEKYLFSSGFLNETTIGETELHASSCNGIPVLFAHRDTGSLLNFDVFAAIFYILSRYEEYREGDKDLHGNYNYKNSILCKLNILHTPVVEQWMELLKEALEKNFPSMLFKRNKACCLLSFDIDVAYAYRNRSFVRTTGGFLKKLIRANLKNFKDQLLTLFRFKKDMFDSYDYIFQEIRNMPAIFFFNMGAYSKHDKNPSYKNPPFRKLIKLIHQEHHVGLHPSYASNSNENVLLSEKTKLEAIIGTKITASRQHYLKLKFPTTYRSLIASGIDKDFTMGYYYAYGFRAGTCNSFLFFDLLNNETTSLRLFPFVFMEGTMNDVLKLSIENAKQTISGLLDTVKKYNGLFIPLWHNSTLCDADGWKGWREVFEHMIRELKEKNFENITHL